MASANKRSPRRRPITTAEILPEAWLHSPGGQAFVRAFSMVGVAQSDLSPPPRVLFGDVCVFMMWAGLPRLAIENAFEIQPNGEVVMALNTSNGKDSHPEGPVALFIAHPDLSEDVDSALSRIEEVVGQLTTHGGLFLAFEHLEDYWMKLSEDRLSGAHRVILDNTWWEAPDLSEDAQKKWLLLHQAVAAAKEPDRLRLSLRWVDEAKRSPAGTDGFLKLWFALEILTGSSGKNTVSRINAALRTTYEMSQSEVSRGFAVGRIFGLRSQIVHHGLKVSLAGPFLTYVAGMYLDILVSLLGFQPSERAREIRDEVGGIDNLLPAVVAGRSEETTPQEANCD